MTTKRCPRCGGNIYLDFAEGYPVAACLQCARQYPVKKGAPRLKAKHLIVMIKSKKGSFLVKREERSKMDNHLVLQLQLYNPILNRMVHSATYQIDKSRRVEVLATGRLFDAGKYSRRLVLLTTNGEGKLDSWQETKVY